MANDKTIKRNIDKASAQAFYTRAVNDHGADIAYSFIPRDDIKYITRKSLENVGVYFGENGLNLPEEFDSKWIKNGYTIGKRKASFNLDENKENIDVENISEYEKINAVKEYILKHNQEFTKEEEDLINVGVYYRNNLLKLPLELSNPLIMFGYYDIPTEIFYDANDLQHKTR